MSVYDKIAASAPVNRQAGLALARGAAFTPNIKAGPEQDFFENPHPLRKVPGDIHDFTGLSYGRLNVVGLSEWKTSRGKKRWLCRCVCGLFCHRSDKSLKAQKAGMCGSCSYTRSLRDESLRGMKNYGRYPDE